MLLLLAACASEPSVDLDEARGWAEKVSSEESDGPGAAGTASMLVGTEAPDPDDDQDGIRLDFENPTTLKRADARCFGGGTVDVAVTVFSADGTGSDSLGAQIPCDEQPHAIDLAAAPSPGSAALIEAHGSTQTYLHVTLIEELTVER